MFFTLANFQGAMNEAHATLDSLSDNPFRGIAEAAFHSVGLGWGWFLLITGAVTILVSSAVVESDGQLSLPKKSIVLVESKLSENIPCLVAACLVVGLLVSAIF